MLKVIKNGLKRTLKRRPTLYLLLIVTAFAMYFWRLGSLTAGIGPDEAISRSQSTNIDNLIDDPVNAPYHLSQWLFITLFNEGAAFTRLSSAIFAIVFIVCFYIVAKSLFGRFVGVLSALILAATPLVILMARNGSPRIMLLSPMAILATYYLFINAKKHSYLSWIGLCAASALCLYAPGSVWVILVGLILGRRRLSDSLKKITPNVQVLGLILALAIVGPLVYGIINNPQILHQLLLIPSDWPTLVESAKSFAWSLLSLVWRTPGHFDLIIARLPFLGAIQVILAIFGVYAITRLATKKVHTLIFIILLGAVASALNNNILLMIIALPAVSLFVAGGLKYLYVEWRQVFPKNPIPKYLALFLMSLLVLMHLAYGLQYALSAWPNTTDTKAVYVIK